MKLFDILFESINIEELGSGGKYIGIELTSGADKLLNLSDVKEKLELGWVPLAKHITIIPPSLIGGFIQLIKNEQLRPKDFKTKWSELGQERASLLAETIKSLYEEILTVEATEFGISNEAIAAKVNIPTLMKFPALNTFSHITITIPPGGKPMNSNNIQNWKLLEPKIILTGKIKIL